MLRVEWIEPCESYDTTGAVERCSIPVEEAVEQSKRVAAEHNYVHESDEEALRDFLITYWATVVDTETGKVVWY